MVSLSISLSISRVVMDVSPLFILLDDPLNDSFIDAIVASSDVDDPPRLGSLVFGR